MIMEGHNSEKRIQFGSRYLKDESKVFEHNAWDDVEWDSEIEEEAKEKIKNNSIVTLSSSDIEKFELDADKYWDAFYCQHQNKFFKDRNWLFTEFEELAPRDNKSPEKAENEDLSQETRILEVGCGVGNTVFPIMQTNNDSNLFIYCCDFAESAIAILKSHQLYDLSRCHAFVCDIAGDDPQFPCPPNSIDFIVLIFVLSAIHPERMESALKRLSQLLKPGGMILFRDYGRYDMAQLRFKPGKCLSDNFYVRGDGTRVYFFTQEELDNLFTKCGLNKVQNVIDRRLQVNRGRQLKMYRVWVQCKYQKPFS